jgi:hypothetical protein
MNTGISVAVSRVWVVVAAAVLTTACTRPAESPDAAAPAASQMQWAREALARNPHLEVLATDEAKGVITVRQRQSGQVMAVALTDLAAAPAAMLQTPSTTTTTSPPPMARTPAPEATTTETTMTDEPTAASAQPSNPDEAPGDTAATSDVVNTEGNYVIQRDGGQVRVSGPGVSIVSAPQTDTRSQRQNTAAATPIICEGSRFMHLDQRTLDIDGTAVIARNGCELHITNSRIQSSGTALSVRDATVHVSNSTLSGDVASVEALGRARLFLRGSTFTGISRRDDNAELNDQGGNTWR